MIGALKHESVYVNIGWYILILELRNYIKYLMSINTTYKGQKRARIENELPVRDFVFQRITPATLTINASAVMVKPFKKVAPSRSWVSKYAQNPIGVHLKEY